MPPTSRAMRRLSTTRSPTGSPRPVLEPVEAVVEPPAGAVVVGERRGTARRSSSGPRSPSWASASGSASPARTAEVRLSTASGHRSRSRARRRRARVRTHGQRQVGGHRREARGDRQHADVACDQREHEEHARRRRPRAGCAPTARRTRPARSRRSSRSSGAAPARARGPRSCRGHPAAPPDEEQPEAEQQARGAGRSRARLARAERTGRTRPARTGRRAAGTRRPRTSSPPRRTNRSAISTTSPSTRPGTATISRTRTPPVALEAAWTTRSIDAATVGTTNASRHVLAGEQRQGAHLRHRLAGAVGVDGAHARGAPEFSAMSRSRLSSWRTSPTTMRDGRMRSASLTSRRSGISPVPSRFGCRHCIATDVADAASAARRPPRR